jgi:hypothetical protein
MQKQEASVCLLNLMNADTGAYNSARTPLGSIADVNQLLNGEAHTYYIIAGIKDEHTATKITEYLTDHGRACTLSLSDEYGRGAAYRSLCAALSAQGVPRLTWAGASSAIAATAATELGWPVVKQTFVADNIEVCLIHSLHGSGDWPALKPAAPAAPQKEEIKIGQKNDGTVYIECFTCDHIDA